MIPTYSQTNSELGVESFDCVELVSQAIEKIQSGDNFNAFIEVFEESARTKAIAVNAKIKAGTQGRLAGMIVAIKDNICYKDHEVTASSKILKGFKSLFNSTVVERLLNEDAIIIGRVGCDEFAMGSSNENSVYGPVKNPLDLKKVSGGSSGGAAAAVAAGLCHVAMGSDTGGSVRQPASFTGIYGLYPTYGRVSRNGLIAYASSFDQISPMARGVDDIALVLEVIAGKDEFDSTCSKKAVPQYSNLSHDLKGKKFAYFKSYVNHGGLDDQIKSRFHEIIGKLKKQGHEVAELEFPYLDYLVPTYYVLTTAESSSNLARYDGIHFGYRSQNSADLLSTYTDSRSEGFGEEVKRRIMLGTFVLSAGYYDAYYTKAQKVRRMIRDVTTKILKEYDFILSPTSPHTAFDIGAQTQDPIKMYLEDIFTVQSNLSGTPAISLPLGKHSNGMPFGVQLISGQFEEDKLLSMSNSLIQSMQ